MKKLTQLLLVVGSIGMGLTFGGCGGGDTSYTSDTSDTSDTSEICSIVGRWQYEDTTLTFSTASEGSEYVEYIEADIFDQGTYTTSSYTACSASMTMTSIGGATTSGNYTISDNNTKLDGLIDVYGNLVTYTRI